MSKNTISTFEEFVEIHDYISDQKDKYEKLAKIFKSKIFGKLSKRFEMRYNLYTKIYDKFAKENEDYMWDYICR